MGVTSTGDCMSSTYTANVPTPAPQSPTPPLTQSAFVKNHDAYVFAWNACCEVDTHGREVGEEKRHECNDDNEDHDDDV